jgi:predicted O-methyltransferase YrrM
MNPDYVNSIPLSTYRFALSVRSLLVLDEIGSDREYGGATDAGTLSMLYTLIHCCQMHRVLQLGTWIGFSTLILADALMKTNDEKNTSALYTVDPAVPQSMKARTYIEGARLGGVVHFVDGKSSDPEVVQFLEAKAPYDLVYIDSYHGYSVAKEELRIYWPLVRPHGFLAVHDSSEFAASFDPENQGGVIRALKEWIPLTPDCEALFMGQPVWQNRCGFFLATKREAAEEGLDGRRD